MTKNNSLIKDEDETKRFIEKILSPLKDDEVYIAVLTARKKYCDTISSSMEVVARDVIRNNDTNKTMRKLKKLGTTEGLYVDKNDNIIPVEAFSLYILPEPRSTLKAFKEFNKDINEWLYSDLIGAAKNLELYRKLDTKLFSAIHRSKSRSQYFIIDIDRKDEDLLNDLITDIEINIESMYTGIRWINETHGGYHIILDRNKGTGTFIHELSKKNLNDVEWRKETMTPVCGTLQGGFLVKEYNIIKEHNQ